MQESLALAERNVPRYTSYPTAPHFNAGVNATVYASWLQQLNANASLSLYVHVPYCTNLCLYCGCHTKVMRRHAPLDDYAQLLRREISLTSAITSAHPVTHLHWGGGTPSILGEHRLAAIVDTLAGSFDLSHIREHAIELDPRHLPTALARGLAAMGVNRASLGVQDFTPRVQAAIGRVQPFDQVRKAVDALREHGIERISFDLMYGLPLQTVADVASTIEQAASLKPDRIALFGYAHVPWFKARQRLIDAAALPGIVERLAQARVAADALASYGYEPVGLDHFARPDDELAVAARSGRLRRNFQGYTTDTADALIGFGVSAIGHLPQGYVQNAADVGNYARAIEAGHPATVRGIGLTPEDRLRAWIIERLMCDLKVDLSTATSVIGFTPEQHFAPELVEVARLQAQGLIELAGSEIRITDSGRPFARLVAATFDAYLGKSQARHSIAV